MAETLDIKPILSVQNGKLDLLEKTRTMKKAQRRLMELAFNCVGGKKVERVGFIHVNNLNGSKELARELCESFNCPSVPLIAEFTPGLSVHTGSGVIGFVIITE